MVRTAAASVAHALQDGKRVLVHCGAGLNRSGVVAVRAMMYLGVPVDNAIILLRQNRNPSALFNRGFVQWLEKEAGINNTPLTADEAEEQR